MIGDQITKPSPRNYWLISVAMSLFLLAYPFLVLGILSLDGDLSTSDGWLFAVTLLVAKLLQRRYMKHIRRNSKQTASEATESTGADGDADKTTAEAPDTRRTPRMVGFSIASAFVVLLLLFACLVTGLISDSVFFILLASLMFSPAVFLLHLAFKSDH